jgi:hypothetical protein
MGLLPTSPVAESASKCPLPVSLLSAVSNIVWPFEAILRFQAILRWEARRPRHLQPASRKHLQRP